MLYGNSNDNNNVIVLSPGAIASIVIVVVGIVVVIMIVIIKSSSSTMTTTNSASPRGGINNASFIYHDYLMKLNYTEYTKLVGTGIGIVVYYIHKIVLPTARQ